MARCQAPTVSEPVIYQSDFRWGYTAPEMNDRFNEIYSSGKRLYKRAYYDSAKGAFILPFEKAFGGEVVLSKRLIVSVQKHIEKALERSYVQNVFFPDMGHSHFFIEDEHWKAKYDSYPVNQFSKMYTELFEDPELKILYHTAEQLKMLDAADRVLQDREIQWRFYTRNIVGDNRGLGIIDIHRNLAHASNTVGEAEHHKYWGAGFNVSASSSGCFPYTYAGKTYYFDLSLSDLPFPPSSDSDL